VLPPVLAGVLVLLSAIDRQRWFAFALSGLLFGVAFIVKQSGGAFVLFAVSYVLLRGGDPRRRLAAVAALVLGALAPFAALCGVLFVTGPFANFWFWTFTYARHYATMTSPREGLTNLAGAVGSILPTCYLIIAVAALGLSALLWDRRAQSRALFVALLGGAALVATSAGLYFRNQYFILLLPVLAILAGVGVDAVARRLASVRSLIARYGITIALAAGPVVHFAYLEREILFTGSPTGVLRALYGFNPFPESVEIARYIRARTQPDDLIAVVGSEPQIYFYAARRAATGYIYTYALMERQPYALAMQRQMMQEIEANNPKFVVLVKVLSSWLITADSDHTIFKWFDEYQQRFDRVGVVEIVSLGQTRYLWGPAASAYTPRSDAFLLILERRAQTAGASPMSAGEQR
jgi:general stress protein CsbA